MKLKLADSLEDAGARFFSSALAGLLFTNAWYSLVSKLDKHADATLMNYGYADPSDGSGAGVELGPQVEADRFALALYHHVASATALRGKDVLEIGCGRGGGAAYVARTFAPRRFVGLDINKGAIAFDRRFYREQKNLNFVVGDAHAMPFPENAFDAVLNIESAHHYSDVERFLGEVHRVLRPGGFLMMACFPRKNQMSLLRESLKRSHFECTFEENITPNVLRALELDSARREELVLRLCPPPLRTFGREFAGVLGSRLYDSFNSGKLQYLNFVLRKHADIEGRSQFP